MDQKTNPLTVVPFDSDQFASIMGRIRNDYGLTLQQWARLFDVTYQAAQKYENDNPANRYNPSVRHLYILRTVLGVSIDDIFDEMLGTRPKREASVYEVLAQMQATLAATMERIRNNQRCSRRRAAITSAIKQASPE